MSYSFRCAQPSDIPRLLELLDQVLHIHHLGRPDLFRPHGSKYTDSQLREILENPNRPIYVLCQDGMVLGYAFCILHQITGDSCLEDQSYLYIDDLCVDAAYRGQGLGSKLLAYVREQARAMGCGSLTLNVWEKNESAKSFYEKEGFSIQKYGMEIKI